MSTPPGVTVVIPCLNEAGTLPLVLEKLNRVRSTWNRPLEVIVSDNGSTDRSAEIATSMGARVVPCPVRGYGAALKSGILAASHEIVAFADADNTYDFLETPRLVAKLEEGFDLVVGSRLAGKIHKGAMPVLHRYLGTPVLNGVINLLYSPPGVRITDCNSGFRVFRKSSFMAWKIESDGMEFASEMLIKALISASRLVQIPIDLHPDTRGRVPHLKTWRDGMRHLLQVLLYSPSFFHNTGAIFFGLGWATMMVSLRWGPIRLGQASVFDLHTMMFALLAAVFGQTVWGMGLFLAAKRSSRNSLYQRVILLGEDHLFWISAAFTLVCLAIFAGVFVTWAANGYSMLGLQKETLGMVGLASTGILFVSQSITAHLLKRA